MNFHTDEYNIVARKAEIMKFNSDMAAKAIKLAGKYKYVLIVIAAGLILILLPGLSGDSNAKNSTNLQTGAEGSYEEFPVAEIEKKICDALKNIEGVGKAEVVLTLKTSMETIYQTDSETKSHITDQAEELEISVETVTIPAGSGYQQPIIIKRLYPEYQGALVVCEGGDRASVRLEVTKAVSALTGLSTDKITVAKRNTK